MADKFQAVVIGGGPGGYVCAIRLAQLGIKTACIESRGSLGGTCLNVGCIPSKSLLNLSEEFHKVQNLSSKGIEVGNVKLNLEKMMKNKDKAVTVLTKGVEFLLKKNKVTYYKGTGSFKSKNKIIIKDDQNKEIIIDAEKTVIATGSIPASLPGIEIDEKIIVSSTGALKLDKVPKKMVVVGGGYIGLEMSSVWSRLGAEVQVVEFLDHITPGMDKEISNEFMKILKKQGINFHMEHKVEKIKKSNTGAIVSTKNKDGVQSDFDCDVVLISVGRKPNTNGLNLTHSYENGARPFFFRDPRSTGRTMSAVRRAATPLGGSSCIHSWHASPVMTKSVPRASVISLTRPSRCMRSSPSPSSDRLRIAWPAAGFRPPSPTKQSRAARRASPIISPATADTYLSKPGCSPAAP